MRIIIKPLGIIVFLLVLGVAVYILLPKKGGDTNATDSKPTPPAATKTQFAFSPTETSVLFDDDGKASADNPNSATIENGARWGTGISGSAIQLEASKNQFLNLGKPTIDTSKSFTVTCWVKLFNIEGYQTMVSQDGEKVSGFYLQKSAIENKFAFTFHQEDSTTAVNPGTLVAQQGYRAVSKEAPKAGEWYQVVGVYDAATSSGKLYINGVLENTVKAPDNVHLWKADGPTIVGAAKWDGNRVDYANAIVDNVHLYQRILTDTEIKDMYDKKN